jgi:hypothetical protein
MELASLRHRVSVQLSVLNSVKFPLAATSWAQDTVKSIPLTSELLVLAFAMSSVAWKATRAGANDELPPPTSGTVMLPLDPKLLA